MRDGQMCEASFDSAGQDVLENGWKFRLNCVSPQTGYFYLLNEFTASSGAAGYSLLFPSPSINAGSARAPAHQPIQTGWYFLRGGDGTEKPWLVRAEQAVSELEAVKGVFKPIDKGVIRDRNRLHSIHELLNKHSQ